MLQVFHQQGARQPTRAKRPFENSAPVRALRQKIHAQGSSDGAFKAGAFALDDAPVAVVAAPRARVGRGSAAGSFAVRVFAAAD